MVYKYVAGKNNTKFYYKKVKGKWIRINNDIGQKKVKYYYNDKNATASGIIVLKKFGDDFKLLALKGNKNYIGKKDLDNNRIYDIPKGRMEKDETPLQTALRETDEESSITELNFTKGLNTTYRNGNLKKQLVIFIATTSQEPKIKKNPETGILEHSGTKWVTWDEMKEMCYGYLKPSIEWGEKIMKK